MPTYICPKCGRREIIGMEVTVILGEGEAKHTCPNPDCGGVEMKEE